MKTKKTKKWVKLRHFVFSPIIRLIFFFHFKIKYRLKYQKFKIKKGERYIIISNHQTTLDPFMVNMTYNKLLYFVASDDLLNIKYASWWIKRLVALIPKSKGKSDFRTIKIMMQVLNENGSIGLFPEGNRTFTGSLCTIPLATVKFIKKAKVPLIIHNIQGGYGSDPRFGIGVRKGLIKSSIKRIISVEEIAQLSTEELYSLIIKELTVQEIPTNEHYVSKKKAEKLERILFLCPECQSISTIYSQGNEFGCNHCGLKLRYNENLTISNLTISNLNISNKEQLYRFPYVKGWYDYQIEWIKNYDVNNSNLIFTDQNIQMYKLDNGAKKYLIKDGFLTLNNAELIIEEGLNKIPFSVDDLEGTSILGKCKIIFRIIETNDIYVITNNKKYRINFNSAKYVFMINHIQNIRKGNPDEFFGI